MKNVKFESMKNHGAGALYSVTLFNKIRFSIGGYGNIKAPSGSFTWFPKITHYRLVATHLNFLNSGISILYRKW